jgi:hypothetical protein
MQNHQPMLASRTGLLAGVLAGLLFMESRRTVPHLVGDDGAPFRLHFAPLRLETTGPTLLRSSVLRDGWSALDDRPMVPAPAWSLPEVVFGQAEADPTFLLEEEVQQREPPRQLVPCTVHETTGVADCAY